jgi:hypothetical protein
MASTDKKTAQKQLNLRMREIINNAYAFVRSREYTKQVANISYEQLLDDAIDAIEGTPGKKPLRPRALERIQKLKAEIVDAVTQVKAKPPTDWALSEDPQENVNTPES